MSQVGIRELLEAGVHFGHQTRRWNPKMRRFIHGESGGIYVIDLLKTVDLLTQAQEFTSAVAHRGGTVLFVGTKKQARDGVKEIAEAAGMPYVNHRWLGGLLTNFQTINQRIKRLHDLERYEEEGQLALLPTRERMAAQADLAKLRANLGGVKNMQRPPDAMFVDRPEDRGHRGARGPAAAHPDHRARGHQLRPGRHRLRHPGQRRRDPLVRADHQGDRRRRPARASRSSAPQEEQARKEAEEQARLQAEERARKEAEEKAAREAAEQAEREAAEAKTQAEGGGDRAAARGRGGRGRPGRRRAAQPDPKAPQKANAEVAPAQADNATGESPDPAPPAEDRRRIRRARPRSRWPRRPLRPRRPPRPTPSRGGEVSTTQISASDVKALRERTGAGMMDCKKALLETGGDAEKAVDWLREKGIAGAAKLGAREATEGTVQSYIHANGKVGVLVEVDCNTDFVARNDDFVALRQATSRCTSPPARRRATSPRRRSPRTTSRPSCASTRRRPPTSPRTSGPKIAEGKLRKWMEEAVLLKQPHVNARQVRGQDDRGDPRRAVGQDRGERRHPPLHPLRGRRVVRRDGRASEPAYQRVLLKLSGEALHGRPGLRHRPRRACSAIAEQVAAVQRRAASRWRSSSARATSTAG